MFMCGDGLITFGCSARGTYTIIVTMHPNNGLV